MLFIKNEDNCLRSCKMEYRLLPSFLLVFIFVFLASCSSQNDHVRDEFKTPRSTYEYWIAVGVKGDLAGSVESLTVASKRMMDQLTKERDVFMQRMTSSAAVFRTYSIVEERVSGDKAIILIESKDKRARIAVPLLLEKGAWKIDLVKMFGG